MTVLAPLSERMPLYTPPDPEKTRLFAFMNKINERHGLKLSNYSELYEWSTDKIGEFWDAVWDETEVLGEKGSDVVVDPDASPAANPLWFPEAKLNWAENMLHHRSDRVAMYQATEPTPDTPNPPLKQISYSQLYSLVRNLVSALKSCDFQPGDRVGSYSSNCIENIAACLATTALGGIWVSAAADFGPSGVLERFNQVQPKIIFSVDGVVYNGKTHPHLPKLVSLLDGLSNVSLSPSKVVVISSVYASTDIPGWKSDWIAWNDFVTSGEKAGLGLTSSGEIDWYRTSFNWPLWILFSSGTTGAPKPIVHRAGGMLLQAKKELLVCADLKPDDIFFYYTTTGWMMWNFLVAGLSLGCSLVLYDGSPLRDPAVCWRLVEQCRISIFGTSAKYIEQLSKQYRPRDHHDLSSLRHIYSTGSPLAPAGYDFVYQHIHPNVILASITGGTDICSLFAGMCSALPVHRGELQCRMLGMAIKAFADDGSIAKPGQAGELVCTRPFPCQPVGFWPLPGFGDQQAVDAAKERYRLSYFDSFKDVWYHGDHVVITEDRQHNAGGMIMLGRSDGVLNPGGIRFGSSEIYDILELCFASSAGLPPSQTIIDALVVGQATQGGSDERVVLFILLAEGVAVDEQQLHGKIRAEIRSRRSPRHVPERIIQVKDIPYTLNSKRVEVPVKKIINGAPQTAVNPATLRNPECLAEYVEIGEVLRAEVARASTVKL